MNSFRLQPIFILLIISAVLPRMVDAGVIALGEQSYDSAISGLTAEQLFSMAGEESDAPVFCQAGDDLGMLATELSGFSVDFPVVAFAELFAFSNPDCAERLRSIDGLHLPPPLPLSLLKVPIRRFA